jgi:tripartite-type tricarboxylate transporter receptor subunit TctC
MATRREFLGVAAGVAATPLAGIHPVGADDKWPNKPIRIVIGFPPGGGLDTLLRVLLPVLSTKLGTSVLIENKPGAVGTIGNETVARSAPDGYTYLATVVASYTTTVKMIKVQYDAIKDLPPVAVFASGGQVFITGANAGFKSLKDVFDYARARPGEVNFGIIGKGTQDHIAGEFLRKEQNLKWEYIPFNSTSLIVQALMRQEIHLTCMSFSVVLPQIQAGTLVPLAVAGVEPSPFVPGIPAAGLPPYVSDYTYAISGPRGLPDAIVNRFHAALTETLRDPGIEVELKSRSLSPHFYSVAESRQLIIDGTRDIAPLLAGMDLRIE